MMEMPECNQSSAFLINGSSFTELPDDDHLQADDGYLPFHLRITCLILLVGIFTVGTIGNIMVTLVISCSRDMRTSTNIFLVNLSIADLLVLVVCTPTALIEVTYRPDRWILGYYMCNFVLLLETTVANTSVLTILAISFERYYAICRPLKANYVCTKSRAGMISLAAWVVAAILSSPMIFMITYSENTIECGERIAKCMVNAAATWQSAYTVSTIILLFLLPFFILLVTYGMIAKRLTTDRSALNAKNENHKARKQVVMMLGTVVFTFFLCLLPFRVLTLFVLWMDADFLAYYGDVIVHFEYFSRIMIYINSALNPILYNIMSSKFRNGFRRLCSRHKKQSPFTRTGTFITNTTTTNSTTMSINLGHQPVAGNGNCSRASFTNGSNGHYAGHNSLGHSSSLRKNVSPSSRPDLLKTLIRTQSSSVAIGTPPKSSGNIMETSLSICNPQCIHYYNNHAAAAAEYGIRHPNGSTTNCSSSPVTAVQANGKFSPGKKPQIHQSFNPHGVNGVGMMMVSNNAHATPANGDCLNGLKHLTVKSDTVYSAYLPGKRSETVL